MNHWRWVGNHPSKRRFILYRMAILLIYLS
jgi:hypothetical protein